MLDAKFLLSSGKSSSLDEASMYAQHLQEKLRRFQRLLEKTDYETLVIFSGEEIIQFQDDLAYPFRANPYFREWAPLNKRPNVYLQLTKGDPTPTLCLLDIADIVHTPPQQLPEGFERGFDIVKYKELKAIKRQLVPDPNTTAFIGESNPLRLKKAHCNPSRILSGIDYQRRDKTVYEHHCVRMANRLAAPAHRAAYEAFMNGESEVGISLAYLKACECRENEMPYPICAAINENSAIPHHFNLDRGKVEVRNSFLIDAGVDYQGYASDIARTYAYDSSSRFAELIGALDAKQLELVAASGIGARAIDMHMLMHRKIAEILVDFEILNCSPEEAVDAGLMRSFCPHYLGHHLGSNVHDRGAGLIDADGNKLPPITTVKGMKRFHDSADVVPNQIHTIEPGLYFIPGLLAKLEAGKHRTKINWPAVNSFIPYGGIRIEDNIVVHENGDLENLTRQAFAAVL